MKHPAYLVLLALIMVPFLMSCTGSATPAPAATAAPTQPVAAKTTASPTQAPATKAPVATQPPSKPAKPLTAVEVAALALGPERQRILEEGAKQEGTVMLYTSSVGLEPIGVPFMKKYPFIKLEAFVTRAEPLTQRTLAEAKAGKLNGDVIKSNVFVQEDLKDLTVKFNTPHGVFSTTPNAANLDLTGISFVYSPKRVPAAEAPKKVEDLLLPRWKQNIGLFAPPNSYPGRWVGALVQFMGEQGAADYLKKLGDQKPLFYTQPEVGRNGLLAGEYDINMQGLTSAVISTRKGEPTQWVALDPTTLSPDSVSLFKAAPHPYSAMLLLDFMLSPEGQKIVSDTQGSITQDELDKGEKEGQKLPARISMQTTTDATKAAAWSAMFEKLVMQK